MKEIDALERNEREGARIRAKEEELKYDDRPTKCFFRKEKQIGLQRQIDSNHEGRKGSRY